MFKSIKNIKWGYVILAILLGAVGACFIMFDDSIKILTIAIGIIATTFGVILGVFSIASKNRGPEFAVRIVIAVVCLASGIVTMVFNGEAVNLIISILCLLLIVDGSFKLNISIISKRHSVSAWWIITVISIAVIVCAFALARYTYKFTNPTFCLGAVILIDAIANLLSAIWVARCESAAKAELYYEVHKDLSMADKK